MRNVLIAASLVASLGACTSSGAIQGNVVVGPGQDGLAVFAMLLTADLAKVDATNPDSRAIATNLTTVGFSSVGIAGATGGSFPYAFHSLDALPAGQVYVLAAFTDKHDDRRITDDEITIDRLHPIVIDPAVAEKASITQNICLATSCPGTATLRGTLHMSTTAAAGSVNVFALDRAINDAEAVAVSSETVSGGTDVPYVLFNVPAGSTRLFARSDPVDTTHATLYAVYPLNPVLAADTTELTGLDLWLDRQAPELGSISGKLAFNAPLSTLTVEMLAFTSNPEETDAPEIEAILTVPAASVLDAPFTIGSLVMGKHYLGASLFSKEATGETLSTFRLLSSNHKAIPVEITSAAPAKTDVVFPLGVGRVTGSINISGIDPAKPLSLAGVFALVPGGAGSPGSPTSPIVQDAKGVRLEVVNGTASTDYVMFGLEDGSYDMALIPDASGDGSFQDEYACSVGGSCSLLFNGVPARVDIVGGGRTVSNFTFTLGH